jgi:serine/threonine protein kinase
MSRNSRKSSRKSSSSKSLACDINGFKVSNTMLGSGIYTKVMRCSKNETNYAMKIQKYFIPNGEEESDDNDHYCCGIPAHHLREVEMFKILKHPNIVEVVDMFQHGNDFFIIMEELERSIEKYIENFNHKKSPSAYINEIYNYVIQILDAVAYLHENGIAHRDLKPANIMLDRKNKIKIIDLNIAKKNTDGYKTPSICTRTYRPPELLCDYDEEEGHSILEMRLQGNKSMDNRFADLWSVGCVIVELLHGKDLFMNDSYDNIHKFQKYFLTRKNNDKNYVHSFVRKEFSECMSKSAEMYVKVGKLIEVASKMLVTDQKNRLSAKEAYLKLTGENLKIEKIQFAKDEYANNTESTANASTAKANFANAWMKEFIESFFDKDDFNCIYSLAASLYNRVSSMKNLNSTAEQNMCVCIDLASKFSARESLIFNHYSFACKDFKSVEEFNTLESTIAKKLNYKFN